MFPEIFLAFVGGLIFGSFLNVLLWRLPEGESILAWYELVPIVSFIFLKGRCRACGGKIHLRYPLVELSSGIVLALFWWTNSGLSVQDSIVSVFAILILLSLFFFDLFYFILPDVITIPGIVIFLGYHFIQTDSFWAYALTALLLALFFAILYGVSGSQKMGFGDIKLAALLGSIFGYPMGVINTVAGIWLAALTAIFLLAIRKATLKDPVPLGSFLTLAGLLSIIFANEFAPLTLFFR